METQRKSYIPCGDCFDNHKCGIPCHSRKCLDEHCDCAVQEYVPGLYLCSTCKLMIEVNSDAYENYFRYITKWYDSFRTEHKNKLYDLMQNHISDKTMGETDSSAYETIQKFLSALGNIPGDIPLAKQINMVHGRKCAYDLMLAFEELKKIQL